MPSGTSVDSILGRGAPNALGGVGVDTFDTSILTEALNAQIAPTNGKQSSLLGMLNIESNDSVQSGSFFDSADMSEMISGVIDSPAVSIDVPNGTSQPRNF